MDEQIRIYIKFPMSGDRLALWVHRELPIGGVVPEKQKNCFQELWKEGGTFYPPDSTFHGLFLSEKVTDEGSKMFPLSGRRMTTRICPTMTT